MDKYRKTDEDSKEPKQKQYNPQATVRQHAAMILEGTYDHLSRNDTIKMERLSKNEEQRMGENVLKKVKKGRQI